jgi:ubiquinone/menaquinone biosynthesis C-methylase UbiE
MPAGISHQFVVYPAKDVRSSTASPKSRTSLPARRGSGRWIRLFQRPVITFGAGDASAMAFELAGKKRALRFITTLLLVVSTITTAVAQQPGVHPVSGRVYARTMGVEGAPWLERREREDEENPDLALRLIRVRRGSTVADIGAGSGYYSVRLAKIVGPMGKVYASDIQAGMLTLVQQNMARAKVGNIIPVLGTNDDPKLPPASIDLAIMVDVYHEFSEPQKMLQRIREALKPDGRLVLLEYRAEDPNVPILRDHKMSKAQVKQELEHEGFKQSRVYDDLPWQHLFIFTKQ